MSITQMEVFHSMKRFMLLLTSALLVVGVGAAMSVSSAGASTQTKVSHAKASHGKRCHCRRGRRGRRGRRVPAGPAGPAGTGGGQSMLDVLGNFDSKSVTLGSFTLTQTSDGSGDCDELQVDSN